MIPEAGQKFGPYEILGRLGGGAMGLVFRAWDARLHREVAIKLLHNDYQMPGMRERFLQEARAASALNHPHICTIFDLGEQDGEPYMVMELLEGETLKEKIARGAVPTDEIISYAQEVADALAAAHAKGIVHRDVKPANIFLVDHPNGRRQAKVLDFGLAKIGLAMRGGRASRALDLTLAGATVGTLSYMSPEQARGQVLDERSDLFSLGVVMYEMATRQVPFQGATSALIFVQLLNHAPEPLHDWNDSIPKELEKIILKLLSKERDARYQTANQLAQALRKIPFRSGGGWLKRAAAAVPLVRASDPVARAKRPVRTSSGQVPVARSLPAPVVTTPVRPISSGDNTLIRPVVRSLSRDSGQRDVGVLRGDRTLTSQAVAEKGDSAEVEAVISQIRAEAATESGEMVVVPARSRSGMTQFEFGLEGIEAEAVADARLQVERRAPVVRNSPLFSGSSTAETELDEEVKGGRGQIRVAITAVVLAAIAGVVYLATSGRFHPVVLRQGDPLLLTVIQNRTGDKGLDGSVMEGLELALDQAQYLAIRGGEAYRAASRQVAIEGSNGAVSNHKIAEVVGAKAYLYGEIKGSGSPYTISVDVLKTDSNDKLTSIEETAEGKEQIAAAIGRIASRVRADMGENEHSITKTSLPLNQEASSDVAALQAYAAGEDALESGRIGDAIRSFEAAKAADPKFTQAHLRLAWLYRAERAETAAAAEAKLAQDTSEGASDRLKLLAQFCFEMNSSGDYGRAAGVMKQFKELYPRDLAGVLGLAQVLRAQGHLPEALQAAQQVFSEDPYSSDAYSEAEIAMTGMDRFQGALQLQEQAHKLGVVPGGIRLAAAYLAGDAAELAKETAAIATSSAGGRESYGRLADYGLYLDNAGRMTGGAALWRSAAANASASSTAASAGPYLLAQGALDRALTKTCSQAAGFASDAEKLSGGLIASFDAGMASALCGDKAGAERAIAALQQNFPHSTAVTGYYVADLQAAVALSANDAKGALAALAAAAPYDDVSLTPYLRGLAHLASGDAKLAVADFQIIVDHRGAAFIGGSNVYPMAQIGLARAYWALGDKVNSKAAYQRFAALWQDGDRGQALLDEALAKGR
jgi:serine/threonine protein kinase